MRNTLIAGWLAALALIAQAGVAEAGVARAASCGDLARGAFAGARIVRAQAMPAGELKVPAQVWGDPPVTVRLPAFCKVEGVAGDIVGFEVWLPRRGWNGRFLSVGAGGFGGSVRTDELAEGLRAGYAVTSNDTGHQGEGREWMADPVRVRAWGRDATHRVTAPAKAIVAAFYGRPARWSYFEGCSTGGSQAMSEAQFYPDDYDGIVAGAPGMAYAHLMLSFLWGLESATRTPDSLLRPADLRLLQARSMRACAGELGRRLGVVEDPAGCAVDLTPLRCAGPAADGCLTDAQLETARRLYAGPRNPRTGAVIYPGMAPGSEADLSSDNPMAGGWSAMEGPLANIFAIPLLRDMAFRDPSWTPARFDWDHDVDDLQRRVGGDIEAMDPDLDGFTARGGKLIMFQGWNDPLNAQTLPALYRDQVIGRLSSRLGRRAAERRVDGAFRLFMIPGLGHCAGGPAKARLAALPALRAWVESGRAPARLRIDGVTRAGEAASWAACAFPASPRLTRRGATLRENQVMCSRRRAPGQGEFIQSPA